MFKSILRSALVATIGLVPMAASAQTTGVFVVHGIPGADGFPVDISVNGACAIEDFTFGNIAGPVALAGTFDIAIYAGAGGSCAGAPALGPVTLTFDATKSYSVVAHLDAIGGPTASVFENDLSALAPGKTRVIAHHTAFAPAVDVTVARDFYSKGRSPRAVIEDFENGEQSPSVEVQPGDWQVAIAPAGDATPVFGPLTVTLEPFRTYLVYAIGSIFDGSFTLALKAVEVGKDRPAMRIGR
jgi:hypothetical protein